MLLCVSHTTAWFDMNRNHDDAKKKEKTLLQEQVTAFKLLSFSGLYNILSYQLILDINQSVVYKSSVCH